MTETTTRRKTEQVFKINASWTPNDGTAASFVVRAFGKSSPIRIVRGKIGVMAAIATPDMANKEHVNRVSDRIAELKAELQATGKLHSFEVTTGALPVGVAERLPEPEPETEVE